MTALTVRADHAGLGESRACMSVSVSGRPRSRRVPRLCPLYPCFRQIRPKADMLKQSAVRTCPRSRISADRTLSFVEGKAFAHDALHVQRFLESIDGRDDQPYQGRLIEPIGFLRWDDGDGRASFIEARHISSPIRSETTLGCMAADRAVVDSPARLPMMTQNRRRIGARGGRADERCRLKPLARRAGKVQCLGGMP